jgi:putative membrane protein
MKFLIKLLVSGLIVLLTAYLLPGVHIDGYGIALLVALVLAVLNTIVKPILVLLTIPLTILTLGLFLLVINAVIILLAGELIGGFTLDNFWWALLFSIIVSIAMSIYESIAKD